MWWVGVLPASELLVPDGHPDAKSHFIRVLLRIGETGRAEVCSQDVSIDMGRRTCRSFLIINPYLLFQGTGNEAKDLQEMQEYSDSGKYGRTGRDRH